MPPSGKEAPSYAQYSTSWRRVLPRRQFESVLSDFIDKTIARLDATGHQKTELHTLWRDVCFERDDRDACLYRILEACLGHDPDEEYAMEDLAKEYSMSPVAVKKHWDYNRPSEAFFPDEKYAV